MAESCIAFELVPWSGLQFHPMNLISTYRAPSMVMHPICWSCKGILSNLSACVKDKGRAVNVDQYQVLVNPDPCLFYDDPPNSRTNATQNRETATIKP